MKKNLLGLINSGKLWMTLCVVLSIAASQAQTAYTYGTTEGFEEDGWPSEKGSDKSATFTASTGTWSIAKNHAVNTKAHEGTNSFYFAEKDLLITPELPNGANELTFYVYATTNRTITVSTSTAGTADGDFTKNTDISITKNDPWKLSTVEINNPVVRYIKFTSNGKDAYIDDILITKPLTVGLSNTSPETNTLVARRYFDILGNPVQQLKPNTVYIRETEYDDGTVKRIKFLNK
jgi:hypothetical protein